LNSNLEHETSLNIYIKVWTRINIVNGYV
jgi:hypothetical protein